MKLVRLFAVCSAAAMLPAAMAQKWEVGAGVGGGFYTSQDVTLGSTSASAKLKTNVAVSGWVGQNMGDRWGGELRYSYQLGDLQLKQNSTEAVFGAETHTINYNFLLYTKPSEASVRPFVSAGAGIKYLSRDRHRDRDPAAQPICSAHQGGRPDRRGQRGRRRKDQARNARLAAPGCPRLYVAVPQASDHAERRRQRRRLGARHRADGGDQLRKVISGAGLPVCSLRPEAESQAHDEAEASPSCVIVGGDGGRLTGPLRLVPGDLSEG